MNWHVLFTYPTGTASFDWGVDSVVVVVVPIVVSIFGYVAYLEIHDYLKNAS